jgi:hypothetical protein
MIRFYIARQRFDAYLVADRLKQAGIRAHVFNEHAASIAGEIPPHVAQPHVWLEHDEDLERARGVLQTMEAEARRGGTLQCDRCGEESPGNFDLCWKCGGALVAAT